MLAHMQREVPSLRRVLPGLNREVNDLVREMLAKEPLRRPADQELVQRLVELELATLENDVRLLAGDPLRQDARPACRPIARRCSGPTWRRAKGRSAREWRRPLC